MPNMMRRMRTRLPTYLSTGLGAFDISSASKHHLWRNREECLRCQHRQNPTLLLGNIAEKFSNARRLSQRVQNEEAVCNLSTVVLRLSKDSGRLDRKPLSTV